MALNENQLKFVELYTKGVNPTDMAKEIGVSRQMIYKYMANEEVKVEVDKRLTEIKNQANKNISVKVTRYIDELEKIALTSESEKLKADTLQYLIDRVLGKATSKIADVTDQENTSKVDIDADLEGLANVVDFDKAKAK